MSFEKIVVKVKKSDGVSIPAYMSEHAAAADAASSADLTILPGAVALVPTGLFFEIPAGYEIQVRPRSGVALKHGVIVPNSPGTIDSDYRGELKIIMMNLGKAPFEVKKGDRIAQLVLARVSHAVFEEAAELSDTKRGHGGFGSTGKN